MASWPFAIGSLTQSVIRWKLLHQSPANNWQCNRSSVLKFASGRNLSALSYGPALGKLINREDLVQNKYSEKGYRDVTLNVSGSHGGNVSTSITNMAVHSQKLSNSLCISFAANIAQSIVGDRQGSNALCDGNALYDEL